MPSLRPVDLDLANAIQRRRAVRASSQEDIAFASGLSVSSISRIERGKADPSWTSIKRIAKALDLAPAELVASAERGSRSQAAPDGPNARRS